MHPCSERPEVKLFMESLETFRGITDKGLMLSYINDDEKSVFKNDNKLLSSRINVDIIQASEGAQQFASL